MRVREEDSSPRSLGSGQMSSAKVFIGTGNVAHISLALGKASFTPTGRPRKFSPENPSSMIGEAPGCFNLSDWGWSVAPPGCDDG